MSDENYKKDFEEIENNIEMQTDAVQFWEEKQRELVTSTSGPR